MYCLNVHPAESLSDVIAVLRGPAAAVKRTVSAAGEYEIGLRLSATAARELAGHSALAGFREELRRGGFVVRHLNGFPYGYFHGDRIKTQVYAPDWSHRERFDYTLDLARILAGILPADAASGTISTVPLGYAREVSAAQCLPLLDSLEQHLDDLEAETGKRICIAFEPEPDCLAGTVGELLALVPPARHRAVLIDTCHAAVNGEDPLECLERCRAAGFFLGRIQLSAALTADAGHAAALLPFCNGVYLNQTRLYDSDGECVAAYPDLTGKAVEALSRLSGGHARVHCHVPLDWSGGDCGTTRGNISDSLLRRALALGIALEIETYTYEVLPEMLRTGGIVSGIIEEEKWLASQLQRLNR